MLDHSYSVRAHKKSQKEMQASQSFAENVCLGMTFCDVFCKMVLSFKRKINRKTHLNAQFNRLGYGFNIKLMDLASHIC